MVRTLLYLFIYNALLFLNALHKFSDMTWPLWEYNLFVRFGRQAHFCARPRARPCNQGSGASIPRTVLLPFRRIRHPPQCPSPGSNGRGMPCSSEWQQNRASDRSSWALVTRSSPWPCAKMSLPPKQTITGDGYYPQKRLFVGTQSICLLWRQARACLERNVPSFYPLTALSSWRV